MADLRDALKNSGLISEKKARKIANEERARRKKLGGRGVDDEKQTRAREQTARESERRAADRAREQSRREEEERRASVAQVAQLLREHAVTRGASGPRRFHFVTRDRKIPFLEVAEEVGRGLESGRFAICDVPFATPEDFVLVPAEIARKAQRTDPECVRFLNGTSRAAE